MSPTSTAVFPQPWTWHVEPDVAIVGSTRRRLIEVVRSWRVPLSEGALRDVELCASELLTNAVQHAGTDLSVTAKWTGELLRVEVWDHSVRPPVAGAADDAGTSGRGLVLIDGLSHSWGWRPAEGGKTVWFEVAADELPAGDQSAATSSNLATRC